MSNIQVEKRGVKPDGTVESDAEFVLKNFEAVLEFLEAAAFNDGWITWRGNEARPSGVTGDTIVIVKLRDGDQIRDRVSRFYWLHSRTGYGDIMEYKIAK